MGLFDAIGDFLFGDDNDAGKKQKKAAKAQAEADAKAKADAEAAAAAEAAAKQSAFDTANTGAYNTAVSDAERLLASMGLGSEYMSYISPELSKAKSSIPNLDSNPSAYYSGVAQNALTAEENLRRQNYLKSLDSFANYGFENNLITDTADDAYIDAILNEQFGTASDFAERAKLRGQVNDVGYDAMLSDLGLQRGSVGEQLQGIGGGILDEGRADLTRIADTGRAQATNYKLGSAFDPLSFQTQINDSSGAFLGGLEGKLRGRIGNTQLFDTSNLLNLGGAAQGAQNLRPVVGGGGSEDEEKRGLGTTGAF